MITTCSSVLPLIFIQTHTYTHNTHTQVPLILLQKMDLLLKKTPPEDVRQHILPTIISSLESSNGQLQVVCTLPSLMT